MYFDLIWFAKSNHDLIWFDLTSFFDVVDLIWFEFVEEIFKSNQINDRRRRDAEGVRPRSGPTTKSSDAEGVRPRSGPIRNREFVDVVMSSDANSFEIEFVRLSAFQIAIFRRISI